LKPITVEREYGADDADEAMRLLGIASLKEAGVSDGERRLKLETWVTQMAVDRQRSLALTTGDATLLRNCTHAPEQLRLLVEPQA
jgi:hypothetical protein